MSDVPLYSPLGRGARVQGSGFRVQHSGCRVQGGGWRVEGGGWRVEGSGRRVQGSGFRVQGSGCRCSGLGRHQVLMGAGTRFPRHLIPEKADGGQDPIRWSRWLDRTSAYIDKSVDRTAGWIERW